MTNEEIALRLAEAYIKEKTIKAGPLADVAEIVSEFYFEIYKNIYKFNSPTD